MSEPTARDLETATDIVARLQTYGTLTYGGLVELEAAIARALAAERERVLALIEERAKQWQECEMPAWGHAAGKVLAGEIAAVRALGGAPAAGEAG